MNEERNMSTKAESLALENAQRAYQLAVINCNPNPDAVAEKAYLRFLKEYNAVWLDVGLKPGSQVSDKGEEPDAVKDPDKHPKQTEICPMRLRVAKRLAANQSTVSYL